MKQTNEERAYLLNYAITDYSLMLGETFCDYIAIVKVDYNLSNFNRFDYIDFHIIVGDNQQHAIKEFNFNESHDNLIDLEDNSIIAIDFKTGLSIYYKPPIEKGGIQYKCKKVNWVRD